MQRLCVYDQDSRIAAAVTKIYTRPINTSHCTNSQACLPQLDLAGIKHINAPYSPRLPDSKEHLQPYNQLPVREA